MHKGKPNASDQLESSRQIEEFLKNLEVVVLPKMEEEKLKPREGTELIHKYRMFQKKIYTPKHVLYPSCGSDISPIKGFPNSKIALLDRDPEAIELLHKNGVERKREGIKLICSDISEYHPKNPHDLLILLNPQYTTSKAVHTLMHGGYIIANNYHGNAQEMFKAPEKYDFVAGIKENGEVLTFVHGKAEAMSLMKESPDHTWIFKYR